MLLDAAGLRAEGGELVFTGPGIEHAHRLGVAALDRAFWEARGALAPAYPRGAELLLCDGGALAALPRTTRVAPTATACREG